MEPVYPVQINIYQSNTYRKDLSWLHFRRRSPVLSTVFDTSQDHGKVVIKKLMENLISFWHTTDPFYRYLTCHTNHILVLFSKFGVAEIGLNVRSFKIS